MGKTILGIAGSSRSAVDKSHGELLLRDLKKIQDISELKNYLTILSKPSPSTMSHVQPGKEHGPVPYSIFAESDFGKRVLSNSEAALWAALWKAYQVGADIQYCSLKDFFFPFQKNGDVNLLRELLLDADAYLLSGPVYFGDRGSLVHELICFLRSDPKLLGNLQGKLYGGIAVGAKRNGGQETTLIYTLLDMINLGLLGVGNDTDTTSQYGGTCHAGDLGAVMDDAYGLATAMGVGSRLAHLLKTLQPEARIAGKAKVLFVILQDAHGWAADNVNRLVKRFADEMEATVLDATRMKLTRCLACDICPQKIDVDEVYRCKVKGDGLSVIHAHLLDHDALIPVAVSTCDYVALKTNYQVFMERTRYLRRGDYVLSNLLVSPLVFQDPDVREFLDIRMITSLIRHNTIIAKPLVGRLSGTGQVINRKQIHAAFADLLRLAGKFGAARLYNARLGGRVNPYRPVGYVVSAVKDNEQEQLRQRKKAADKRVARVAREADRRLKE